MHKHVQDGLKILECLRMPRAQRNERSALCLLALLHLTPDKNWEGAESPLMGITPIMEFCRTHYKKEYAPNTREAVRRQTMPDVVLFYPEKQWLILKDSTSFPLSRDLNARRLFSVGDVEEIFEPLLANLSPVDCNRFG
jgi:hypothetical protein